VTQSQASKTTRTTPEYNLGYQTVVDISETKDFEITVGWTQPSSYRHNAIYDGIYPIHAITPLNYASSTQTCGNGVLGVYVLNELTNPSAQTDDCYIVVSMSAGDDFEVAAPTNRPMSRLRYRTHADVAEPQSDEYSAPVSAVASKQANTEEAVQHADTLAITSSLTSHTNDVFFGESIRSFRSVLKRFCMSECTLIPGNASGVTNAVALQRPAFPIEPGYTSKSDAATNRVPRLVSGKNYVYGFLTPLRFISSGFVGWRGGVRWKVLATYGDCCAVFQSPSVVTRYSGCTPLNIVESVGDKATNAGLAQWYIGFDEYQNAQEGAQIVYGAIEPVQSFEVPYYTSRRFLPARSLASFEADAETVYKPCWKTSCEIQPNANITYKTFCAAAEDFTLGMFIGAPIVYLESINPQ
jgi:hypothetical protein